METLTLLYQGFQNIMDPMLLLMCLFASIMGTLVGVLPGLGPAAAIAVLLPVVYGMDPLTALVMLAGIFSGSMFGGSITSITLNVPGEGASVVTTFDGYQMAKQGKAGVALGISTIGSFIGCTFGLILLTIFSVPLADAALSFGPPEYFAIYVFTFVAILSLGGGTLLKSSISLFLGLLVSTVGIDVMSGAGRLTFGSVALTSGIDYMSAIVGLFGLSEIILSVADNEKVELQKSDMNGAYKLRNLFPSVKEFMFSLPAIIRGSIVGFFMGILPGTGATVATFSAYSLEKRMSKDPDSFGKGNIRGVAAPETANNASALGHFVPLLSLGIPSSGTMAVLLSGFIILGIQPGPRLFTEHPDVAWGLIASMYLGNIILVIINIAWIPFFIWVLRISQKTLPVIVATLCVIGTYSVNNAVSDVLIMLIFAGIGVFFKKLDIPPAPAIVAIVLGRDLEFSFRQTLEFAQGNFLISFTRPLTVGIYIAALILLMLAVSRSYKMYKARKLPKGDSSSISP